MELKFKYSDMQKFVEKEDREWLFSVSARDELNTHIITGDREVLARKYLLQLFSNLLMSLWNTEARRMCLDETCVS